MDLSSTMDLTWIPSAPKIWIWDEQTIEILNNAQSASYVANCARKVEDDSNQPINQSLVWLTKENDIRKMTILYT